MKNLLMVRPIEIKKADFDRARRQHPDYISRAIMDHTWNGKTCKRGEWTAFEGAITGDWSRGAVLIFQHIHFEII